MQTFIKIIFAPQKADYGKRYILPWNRKKFVQILLGLFHSEATDSVQVFQRFIHLN